MFCYRQKVHVCSKIETSVLSLVISPTNVGGLPDSLQPSGNVFNTGNPA